MILMFGGKNKNKHQTWPKKLLSVFCDAKMDFVNILLYNLAFIDKMTVKIGLKLLSEIFVIGGKHSRSFNEEGRLIPIKSTSKNLHVKFQLPT